MLKIKRVYTPRQTIGFLTLDNNPMGFTIELPYLENRRNVSCIPEGDYKVFYRLSPKNGHCLQLVEVPKRSYIQIHKGNYSSQIRGCILIGTSMEYSLDKGYWVSRSTVALDNLLNKLNTNLLNEENPMDLLISSVA